MYKINPDISVKKIADELFMYNRQQSLIHSFNDCGALILELIQKQLDIEQIHLEIMSQYEIDEKQAREDLLEFIQTLVQQNIIAKVP